MKAIKPRSGCPVSYTLDFLGDKWTLLILRDMVMNDKSTYGEFLASGEKIATNILADRLNTLETYGFVTKTVSPEKKTRLIYTLTEKGIALVPIIVEMGIWGSTFNPPGLDQKLLDQLATDKEGTIRMYQQRLKDRLKTS